jgi:hypothetical protein
MTRLSDHERANGGTIRLDDDQFDKLVELLTPGYELSKIFLAQHLQASEGVKANDAGHGDPNVDPAQGDSGDVTT